MSKHPLAATAEGMSAITRRSFLRSTAGAGAATLASGSAVLAAEAMPDDKASAIDALLADYLAERRRDGALLAEWRRADDSLPVWVKPGPSEMYADGSKGGHHNGWPELEVLPTPDPERPGAKYVIRPSVQDAWKEARSTIYDGPHFVRNDDGTVTALEFVWS